MSFKESVITGKSGLHSIRSLAPDIKEMAACMCTAVRPARLLAAGPFAGHFSGSCSLACHSLTHCSLTMM